jgi:hypothetical protein
LRGLPVALGAALLLLGSPALAQSRCGPPPGDAGASRVVDVDPEARLAFVRAALLDQAARERLWSRGWALGGVGLAGGNFGLAALQSDRDKRTGYVLSGIPALFFPLEALVDPPKAIRDSRLLEDLLASTAGIPGLPGKMDTCVLLGRAEALLADAARDERARVNLFRHGLGVAVALGLGAILTFGLHDTAGGILDLVGSLAVSEVHLWTAPTGAAVALTRYREAGAWAPPEPKTVGLWLPIAF